MKSKLFTRHSTVSEDFSKHFNIIVDLEIPDKLLNIIAKSISQYTLAATTRDEENALMELREKWPKSPKEMEALLGIGRFLIQRMDLEDSIDLIIEDLKSLAVVKPAMFSRIQPFIEALWKEFNDDFSTTSLAIATQNSCINTVKNISHVVDFRAIVPNEFKIGDNIKNYEPKISKLVPVGIVEMRFSNDKTFKFQLSRYTLKYIMNNLNAIEKEFDAAMKFVETNKIHSGRI